MSRVVLSTPSLRSALGARAYARKAEVLGAATEALAETVREAADVLEGNLEAATTRTGERRAELGIGLPGRHRTGTMVESISHNADSPERGEHQIVVAFGWFPEAYQDYFRDQDLGEGQIPAARAMAGASVHATVTLDARLKEAVR